MRITKPFYMGVYEVTTGQFGKFVQAEKYRTDAEMSGNGGYGFIQANSIGVKPEFNWRNLGVLQQDANEPVLNVTWNDAKALCQWLTKQEGRKYRLPTEAEWEYACRAGTTTRFYNGDDPQTLGQIGHVYHRGADSKAMYVQPRDKLTAPVGKFRPNAFGLYDMVGNVGECCSDFVAGGPYDASSPLDDPQGPASGFVRVTRGSGWQSPPWISRSSFRSGGGPQPSIYVGFPVVREP